MKHLAALPGIAGPKHIAAGTDAIVALDDSGDPPQHFGIPHLACRKGDDAGLCVKEKSSGEPVTPSKKGLPNALRRRLSEILRHQLQGEDTIFLEDDLLAPMRVEQFIAVELQQPADQSTIGGIRMSLDGGVEGTEQRRQRMGFKGQPRDDAETAAASALDAPVEVRVHTAIGEAHLAVRRGDLGCQNPRRHDAVTLREPAISAYLPQARDAHRGAAAALNVASVLSRDRIVDLHPNRTCLHRHRRPRVTGCAAMRHEGIVDVDRVHGRVQISKESAAFDVP